MLDTTRLDQFIAEGRLIRKDWTGTDAEGRETACLLAALSPEVAKERKEQACPADIMPSWLAHLTPWINDAGSTAEWPAVVRRYAALARRWHVLDAAGWRRAEYRVRRAAVVEAKAYATTEEAAAVCQTVIALCDREIAGEPPAQAEWTAAWKAAAAVEWAAEAAAEAAEWAAAAADVKRVAARATAAARAEAANAVARAAETAARAAVRAAAAARAAAEVAWARAEAEAVADRIITAILDGIETEIIRAEQEAA
jgi:hypothetical protein